MRTRDRPSVNGGTPWLWLFMCMDMLSPPPKATGLAREGVVLECICAVQLARSTHRAVFLPASPISEEKTWSRQYEQRNAQAPL